jgi:poly(A) polymerase
MTLLYDADRDAFIDRFGVYPDLRSDTLAILPGQYPPWLGVCEAAKLVSRYHYSADGLLNDWNRGDALPPVTYQKTLLVSLLLARHSGKGLSLLQRTGMLDEIWPELASMTRVFHGKDYHPEGNVWEHTLEALKYRKRTNLILSLALLLHDSGKPATEGGGERRFDGHAEAGSFIAARFLRRLGFSEKTVEDVVFLVRHHMMPPALKKLPPYRSEKVLASPLFPLLLELYRADISSSYIDEEGYYEACRIYKGYLKDRANPYLMGRKRSERAMARRR